MLSSKVYNQKRFLIVDDMSDMRAAVKRMVEAIGGQNIDQVSNGEEAIVLLGKRKYDIVLCDYSLGDGKDGQQVLEEVRFRKTLPNTTIFMMLTAESTAEMVMGALEYEPDGYIVKPFTKDMFHQRLEKIVVKKEKYRLILSAIDVKKWDAALALCDKEISESQASLAYKLKATIMMEQQQFEEAKHLVETLIGEKSWAWCWHILGKCECALGHYDEAMQSFEKVLHDQPKCLDVVDWMARTLLAKKEYKHAFERLVENVRLSPKSILRQRLLGEVASLQNEYAAQEKAFRQAIRLGKNSCYQDIKDSFWLCDALLQRTINDTGLIGKKAANEIIFFADEVSKAHRNEPPVLLMMGFYKLAAYILLERPHEAKKMEEQLEKLREVVTDKLPVEYMILIVRMYHFIKAGEEEEKWLDKASESYPNHPLLEREIEFLKTHAE